MHQKNSRHRCNPIELIFMNDHWEFGPTASADIMHRERERATVLYSPAAHSKPGLGEFVPPSGQLQKHLILRPRLRREVIRHGRGPLHFTMPHDFWRQLALHQRDESCEESPHWQLVVADPTHGGGYRNDDCWNDPPE